jgi:RNA polymerase sigma factor (sigma-70 family)
VTNETLKGLFLAHQGELQAYLMKQLRNAEAAADLTQETFLRYAERTPAAVASIANERSYLYRTAHNLAVDYVRQQSRRRTDLTAGEAFSDIADDRPNLEEETAARQRLAQISATLAELPELTRKIFILNRLDGLTYAQVAERLSISDSSVQKHLAKALALITRRLRETNSR